MQRLPFVVAWCLILGCPSEAQTTDADPSSTTDAPSAVDTTTGASDSSSASTSTSTGSDEGTTGCVTACGTPAGCDESESGGSAGGDDTGFGMNGDPPLAASIPDIQQGKISLFTLVQVEGVVVTSPVIEAPVGSGSMFTIADPIGGQYSGATVRVDAAPEDVALERGEGLTLQAEVRNGIRWLELRALPEWIASEGTVAEPSPVELDLQTVQGFAADPWSARPYDSVVVAFPPSSADASGCRGELQLAYGEVRVDDRYLWAQGVPLPPPGTFDAIGGTLLYTLNGLEIAPRSLDELAP